MDGRNLLRQGKDNHKLCGALIQIAREQTSATIALLERDLNAFERQDGSTGDSEV